MQNDGWWTSKTDEYSHETWPSRPGIPNFK